MKHSFTRFFRPLDADYNTVTNPYVGRESGSTFKPEGGRFPTLDTDYSDHEA